MRQITLESLYFVFRDADGILGFSIKAYEGEPENPRFLYDGNKQLFLLRRPGQVISLDALAEEFLPVLARAETVRFLETPEDSSEIIRQYDIAVTKINSILLSDSQIVSGEPVEHILPQTA